jgi:hypothetical protein
MRRNPRLDADVEITRQMVEDALKRPRDFGYGGEIEGMFKTWSIGPVIQSRDSRLLEKSNAAALVKHLESDPSLEGEWEVNSANHWAVGWVDHLSFKVLDENGEPTRVFRVLEAWKERLSNYSIADEEDYSERESEATVENIEYAGKGFVSDDADEDWPLAVYTWLSDNDQSELENRDDQGGYPSDDALKDALDALGFLEEEDE